jgi:glycosyltransferase involved in cell wall biosynthesis
LKILFLNQTFHPDVVSTAQHLSDLAAELAARGHSVTVVAGRRAYDNPRKLFPKHEIWRGVRIVRVGSTGFGKGAKWRRVLDFASFGLLCLVRAVFLARHDVIVALTSPPLISLVGLCLAVLRRSRFVYWVMDLNPDEAIAAGWICAGSLSGRTLGWISRATLRNADRVVVLDPFVSERIVAKGAPAERIRIFPPWSHDTEVEFDPLGRERFRAMHGLTGRFVVMHSGNHSVCHPLDTVVEAARRMTQRTDIVFCFVGGGTEWHRIRRMFGIDGAEGAFNGSNSVVDNVVCLPYQPLNELSASLSAADLHLVIHGNDFVGIVHPCKIYNILRIGTPVAYIGPDHGPISDILKKADGQISAFSVRHGDAGALVRQIEQLQAGSRSPRADGGACCRSEFSRDFILPKFVACLEELSEM